MIINRIFKGFVAQQFDTTTGKFINQQFISDDQSEWENEQGDSVESPKTTEYLPLEMIQPTNPGDVVRVTGQIKIVDFQIGDTVIATPWPGDDFHEFQGTVRSIRKTVGIDDLIITVVDQEDNCQDCWAPQLKHA